MDGVTGLPDSNNPFYRAKVYALWIAQGRHRRQPVVLKRGHLMICPHNQKLLTLWQWSFYYMRREHGGSGIWDVEETVLTYMNRGWHEYVDHLQHCAECREALARNARIEQSTGASA